MDKILYVKKKNVYGNELVYPVCKDAKLFANLTKQKTLSTDDIARIKSLGYVFKHVEEKIWLLIEIDLIKLLALIMRESFVD